MYAYQIRKCLEQDPIVMNQFNDIYSADELLNHEIQKRPSLIIANTGLSWTLGEHWTVIYYAEIGGINEFFDSFGRHPSSCNKLFTTFLEQDENKYVYYSKQLQSERSGVCGLYCLFYSYYKCRGKSMHDVIKDSFTINCEMNDLFVYDFARKYLSCSFL